MADGPGPPEHYFSPRPAAPSRPREWTAVLRGRTFHLLSDRAVFAGRGVDRGTHLLVEALPVPPAGNILDLGCGYGVIGLVAAALAPRARVYLVDINARACGLARQNLARNGVSNAEVREGDGFAPVAGLRFALIATNPPLRAGKALVFSWIEGAAAHLAPGGQLVLVARTRQGARSLAAHMARVFWDVAELAKGGGYRVYAARGRPAGDDG